MMVSKEKIEIEDDSLREGAQCPGGRILSADDRIKFVNLLECAGIDHFISGYPGTSHTEVRAVLDLLKMIDKSGCSVRPWVLSRLNKSDISLLAEMKAATASFNFGVAFFIAVSDLRIDIEGWNRDQIADAIQAGHSFCSQHGLPISLNLEDITRASNQRLEWLLEVLAPFQFESIVLCDSLGIALPEDVTTLVSKVKNSRPTLEKIGWHGHNDLGLATANSVAAVHAGARIISGTFTGIGERAGNLALEQFLLILNEKFGASFDLKQAIKCCDFLMRKYCFSVSDFAPLIGDNCYKTQVGTHGAAILKSRGSGIRTDSVYTPFDYEKLGREVEILLGPQNGKKMVADRLKQMGVHSSEIVDELFFFLKGRDTVLADQELELWLKRRSQ